MDLFNKFAVVATAGAVTFTAGLMGTLQYKLLSIGDNMEQLPEETGNNSPEIAEPVSTAPPQPDTNNISPSTELESFETLDIKFEGEYSGPSFPF